MPSGRDPWVWPDNPAYPPQPHLRYPLTSKDEDPNKKILARQSCSRAQRTLLFYLLYNSTTQKTDTTSRKSTAVVHNLATEEDTFHNISMLGAISRYTNTDTNIIAVHTSIPYGASEEETQRIMRNARNESFTTLLKLATDREDLVKAFVIERTRQSEENQKDRQTIQRLTRNNIIPPINYVQVSSTAERNLWAADAVAYSMAQALLRSDLTLQEKSGIQLSIYDTQTLGLIDLKAPTNNLTSKLGIPTDPRQLRTEHLPHVTTGIAAREETLKNLRDNLRPGQRLLGPEKAHDDLLYRKAQGIGRSRLMDPHHAADLTIGPEPSATPKKARLTNSPNVPKKETSQKEQSPLSKASLKN